MNGEIVLTKQEMMLFLNKQPDEIHIDYPLTNEQILTLETEEKHYNIDLYIDDEKDFSDSELWDHEKPSYNDYLQSFLASNLITYKNIEELNQTYRSYLPVSSDVIYAPDTNLFYNQFISTGVIPTKEILIVDSVHKEINRVLNKKYNPNHITDMKRCARAPKTTQRVRPIIRQMVQNTTRIRRHRRLHRRRLYPNNRPIRLRARYRKPKWRRKNQRSLGLPVSPEYYRETSNRHNEKQPTHTRRTNRWVQPRAVNKDARHIT